MKLTKPQNVPALPSPALRRQIDNEVVFRKANEKVQKDLNELRKIAKTEGHEDMLPAHEMPIHFYCECSDENCKKRIAMTLKAYQKFHKDRRQFIVLPGHQTPAIEHTVLKKRRYNIVDKFLKISSKATKLKSTSVNNV